MRVFNRNNGLPLLMLLFLAIGSSACDWMPGKPDIKDRPVRPSEILDFKSLYATNCAACHGADGTSAGSTPIGDPVYLDWITSHQLQTITARGIPGTMMPAFAIEEGGSLTDQQIEIIAKQIVTIWGNPKKGAYGNLPSYRSGPINTASLADVTHGHNLFRAHCAGCHGLNGKGGKNGGSVIDNAYLALVSNQGLRTSIIIGRPHLGMPGFAPKISRGTLSSADVDAIVTYLASHRSKTPGQPYPSKPVVYRTK